MDFKIIKNDPDYAIHMNLNMLAKFRNETITGIGFDGKDGSYPMSDALFTSKRDNTKYIVVKCDKITFLHLCKTGDYHKKAKLSTLLSKIATEKVIIIKHEKFNIKEIAFDGDSEILDGDRYLLFNWYEVQVNKGGTYRHVTNEEWDNNLIKNNFLVDRNELPGIGQYSHEAVLIGCKIGDIIECTFPSLSSNGTTCSYRRVTAE